MNRLLLVIGLLIPSVSWGFVRSETTPGSGVDLSWPTRSFDWYLSGAPGSNIAPGVSWDDGVRALLASFQTWQNVSCTTLSFTFDGPTDRTDIGFNPSAMNNINLLVFRSAGLCSDPSVVRDNDPCHTDGSCANQYNCWDHDTGIYALTTTNYNLKDGTLADADIEFNAAPGVHRFSATTQMTPVCANVLDPTEKNCVATDVQNTATHEVGHFLGLAHSPVSGATMQATAADGETSKRILSSDDINGICLIYPHFTAPAEQPSSGGCASTDASLVGLAVSAVLLRFKALRRKS